MVKSKIASVEVPTLVTEADVPGSPVIVVPAEMVAVVPLPLVPGREPPTVRPLI
jgi:hypothetical protein